MIRTKWTRLVGWVLSIRLGVVFVLGAGAKLSGAKQAVDGLKAMGLKGQVTLIGCGELLSAILFLIPLTHPLGVLLLSSYMGGAILAHMSRGESYASQSVILVMIWVAGFLRRPALFVDPPGFEAKARPDAGL